MACLLALGATLGQMYEISILAHPELQPIDSML